MSTEPSRRAASNATSQVERSMDSHRSRIVRATLSAGMFSTRHVSKHSSGRRRCTIPGRGVRFAGPVTSIGPATTSNKPCSSAAVRPDMAAPAPAQRTVAMQRIRFVVGAASMRNTRGRSGWRRPRLRRPLTIPLVTPPVASWSSATTPCWRRASNWRQRSTSLESTRPFKEAGCPPTVTCVTWSETSRANETPRSVHGSVDSRLLVRDEHNAGRRSSWEPIAGRRWRSRPGGVG